MACGLLDDVRDGVRLARHRVRDGVRLARDGVRLARRDGVRLARRYDGVRLARRYAVYAVRTAVSETCADVCQRMPGTHCL